jgi:glutaredoxin
MRAISRRWPIGLIAFWILAAGVAGARAELLVLADGTRLETRGEFTVKGLRVFYTDAQGRAMTLPLASVDLAASMQRPPAATPPPAPAVQSTPAAPRLQAAPAQVRKVEMYTTDWCVACRKARTFLDRLGIAYRDYDIDRDPVARERKRAKDPRCGLPVIEIDGKVLCGFDTRELRAALKLHDPAPTRPAASTVVAGASQ